MTYTLWRNCPRTGFRETISFDDPIRNKPKGWKAGRYWYENQSKRNHKHPS